MVYLRNFDLLSEIQEHNLNYEEQRRIFNNYYPLGLFPSKEFSHKDDIIIRYKKFLSFGNSVSIKEALKYIDIDLNDNKYIDDAIDVLKTKIRQIKNLTNYKN